jgi:mRNA-degrading endonuclease RelE of RelBE toxin-antitoxin system
MHYRVFLKKKVDRKLKKLPSDVRKLFFLLLEDLKDTDPIRNHGRIILPWERTDIIVT